MTALLISTALATTPDDNDIPTLAMRIRGPDASYKTDFPIELLCELSWLNFDAVNFDGDASVGFVTDLMTLCDSMGLYYSFCPVAIMQYQKHWADSAFRFWFRYEDASLTSDSAFAQCNADYDSLIAFMPADSFYSLNESISIKNTTEDLSRNVQGHDYIWFYEVYDEANARQGKSSMETSDIFWDDYIPNVYTQARGDNGILTLEEVEASGLYSIQKYYAENDSLYPVTFAMNFALIHRIDQTEYSGLTEDRGWATMETLARCVRAVMEAEYQPPPDTNGVLPNPQDNSPEFVMFDYYPFRQVHPDSATAEMCDADWLFLVNHFEEGIDSTVITASEYDVPVFYMPQTFGKAGGEVMMDDYGAMDYRSYYHRKPSPREFRMLCNLALLHQAKGIFPYNLCSYMALSLEGEPHAIMSSLLDRHNIPFDADYEEWRYTGRWPTEYDGDYSYIRPDSLPPWRDGYDPLYNLPSPPDTSGDGAKALENWYEWHFAPYADLYSSIGSVMGEIKTIGPEMHDLWWWEENGTAYWDVPEIWTPDSALTYASPRIRLFRRDGCDNSFIFYVNRSCAGYVGTGDDAPFTIRIEGAQCPGDLYYDALDHSRRCLVPVEDGPRDWYLCYDTLAPGQSRLLEFVDLSSSLPADLRVTSPDVYCYPSGSIIRRTDHRCKAGVSLNLGATFYNMGTDSVDNVIVTFYDSTSSETLGLDTLDFEGLDEDYQPDSVSAEITWDTDSTDIGVHRVIIEADTVSGEASSDNAVCVAVLVEPRDYATEARGNAWDMEEDSTDAWFTSDIEGIALNWSDSAWTDSVSGMFEGSIRFDSSGSVDFRGDIYLSIPDDTSQYIETDRYHMLSMGIAVNNPWRRDNNPCSIFIDWTDTENSSPGWSNLLGSNFSLDNGWDGWRIVGPIDLDSIAGSEWADNDVTELRMRFQSNAQFYSIPPDYPDSIDVRIGWMRLEEAKP